MARVLGGPIRHCFHLFGGFIPIPKCENYQNFEAAIDKMSALIILLWRSSKHAGDCSWFCKLHSGPSGQIGCKQMKALISPRANVWINKQFYPSSQIFMLLENCDWKNRETLSSKMTETIPVVFICVFQGLRAVPEYVGGQKIFVKLRTELQTWLIFKWDSW